MREKRIKDQLIKYKKYLTPKKAPKGNSYFGGFQYEFLENNGLEKMLQLFKKCKKNNKILCIPLSLKSDQKTTGHANMLIFNFKTNTIERYEPHGIGIFNKGYDDSYYNQICRKITEYFNDNGENMTFVPPDQTCPRIGARREGFQNIESSNKVDEKIANNILKDLQFEKRGYCVMWSMFIMDLRLKFPNKKPKELFSDALKLLNKKEGDSLSRFIRGFTNKFVDELRKVFKDYDKAVSADDLPFKERQELKKRIDKLLDIKNQ